MTDREIKNIVHIMYIFHVKKCLRRFDLAKQVSSNNKTVDSLLRNHEHTKMPVRINEMKATCKMFKAY